MRNPKQTLALAAAFIAVVIAAPTLYAQETRRPAGSMMGGGMMGGGNKMGRMSGMMDHCGAMMQGDSRGDRPNDQWRKRSPSTPDKDD